jgi:hypothetical protein
MRVDFIECILSDADEIGREIAVERMQERWTGHPPNRGREQGGQKQRDKYNAQEDADHGYEYEGNE